MAAGMFEEWKDTRWAETRWGQVEVEVWWHFKGMCCSGLCLGLFLRGKLFMSFQQLKNLRAGALFIA